VKEKALTDRQLEALHRAYAAGHGCYEGRIDDDGSGDANPAVLRSLLRRGLVEPDPDGDEGRHRATEAGRAALGVKLDPPPADFAAALDRAILTFFGPMVVESEDVSVRLGAECGEVLIGDDERASYRGALAQVHNAEGSFARGWGPDRGELEWAAVQTMLCELGFPVTVEVSTRGPIIAGIWRDGRRRKPGKKRRRRRST
jgi:hypothetical protein